MPEDSVPGAPVSLHPEPSGTLIEPSGPLTSLSSAAAFSVADVACLAVDLLAAATAGDVADVLADRAGPLLGASMVLISLLEPSGDRLRWVTARNAPTGLGDVCSHVAVDTTSAPGEVTLSGEAVFLTGRAERQNRYPAARPLDLLEASASLPLTGLTGVLGTVCFGYDHERAFVPVEVSRFEEIARMTGMALQRVAALDAEREARRAAETTTRRLRTLQRASSLLAEVIEPHHVLDVILTEVTESLEATGVLVAEYDRATGTARALAAMGMPQTLPVDGRPFLVSNHQMIVDLVVTGRPIMVSSLSERDSRYPGSARHRGRQQAWAILPLLAGGEVAGWVSFGWDEPRTFDDDVEFLVALAAHIAPAVERARLLAQVRSAAEVLQKSLLPEVTRVPGWQRASLYLPAPGIEVGGDWFDAFPLSQRQVGVVIGDVAGKGTHAAAVMGAVRSALRAYAALDPAPERVLALLDTYLARYSPDELITCIYGVLEPDAGRFRYANAGHPPALIADRDSVRWLDMPVDPPLGTMSMIQRHAAEVDLVAHPGDGAERGGAGPVLLLYSDGLVERRHSDLQRGLDDLAFAARRLPGAMDLNAALADLCAVLAQSDSIIDDRAAIAFRRRRSGRS